MKKKRHFQFLLIFFMCIIIGIAILKNSTGKSNKFIVENVDNKNDFMPAEEISDEQNRKTIITLYFYDSDSDEIIHEARSIDVKELAMEPYEKIIEYLMKGAENENIGSNISESTKLNLVKLDSGKLILDFNEEFNKDIDPTKLEKICEAIKKTFIEFNEIEDVIFLINGKEIER